MASYLNPFTAPCLLAPTGEFMEGPGSEPSFANIIAWYRGDVMAVGQMTDRSGNGNHLVQGTAGNQASLTTDAAIRNQPCLAFTTDDFYSSAAIKVGGVDPSAYTEYTLVAVVKKNVIGETGMILEATDATTAVFTAPALFLEAGAGGVGKTVFSCASSANAVTLEPGTTNWHWIAGIHNGATRKLYINGSLVGTNAVADTSPAIRKIGVGRAIDAVPFYPLNGRIAEIILTGHALTPGELTALGSYITGRYGL